MGRAEKHESFAMLGEHFFFHNRDDVGFAVHKFHPVVASFDPVPVNRGIASQHAEALGCGELLIDGAKEREELLEKPRVPAHGLRGISPYFADFGKSHILPGDVTVENMLVERIAAFDFKGN